MKIAVLPLTKPVKGGGRLLINKSKKTKEMIQELNGINNLEGFEDKNLKIERIEISVTSSAASVSYSKFTDTRTKKVVGVAISSDDDDALVASTLSLSIRAKEFFPSNFGAKMLMCGQEVAPNRRYFIFNTAENVDRSEVRGEYKDGAAYTGAYNVTIYLLCFEE